MTVIFESHATSVDNEQGIASGHHDSPLSRKGMLQAHDLGTRYLDIAIEVVYCSDLIRSRDTAKIAFKSRDLNIMEDTRLREWNYGDLNGSEAKEIETQKKRYIHTPFPNGESLLIALKRIDEFLDDISANGHNKPLLIIGHRAVFYALEHRYKKCPLEELVAKPWSWQPGWAYSG